MKSTRQIIGAIFIAGWLCFCAPSIFAVDAPAASGQSFPLTLTDGADRTVKIAATPHRVISLSPAATDMLVKVGANPELVGVTRYCDNPAIVESRVKRLGGVLDPDYEGMVALKPDLVVMPWLADKSMQDKLTSLGLTFVELHPEGLAGVLADIQMLGRATGHNAEGEAVVRSIELIQQQVSDLIKNIAPEKRPRVLIRMDDVSPAPGSYVDDLLTAAGGRNVLPRGAKAWVTVSPESILQLKPDLIVDIPLPDSAGGNTAAAPRPSLGNIPSKTLPNGLPFYRPGPDVGDALLQLMQTLYPIIRINGNKPALAPITAHTSN